MSKIVVRIGFDESALDPSFKSHAHRGIGRYVRELSRYFDRVDPKRDFVGRFDHRSLKLPRLVDTVIACAPAGRQTLRQQIAYPLQLDSERFREFDILHFPAHMDAPSWCRKRCIVTVLDLIPLVLEELYRAEQPGWRFQLARFLEVRAIRRAELILAISETTKTDLERLLGIPGERIVVTPLGVDRRFFSSEPRAGLEPLLDRLSLRQEQPILLYVGGIDPRKNWKVMLRAVKEARQAEHEAGRTPPVLVLAGNIQGDKQYPLLEAEVRRLELQEAVRTPGFLTDDELMQLFSHARLFLFPSLYEGFGLPPLEAMAGGLPVVSSNASCMPEVLGDAALFFDPHEPSAAAQQILAILRSPELATQLREAGVARAKVFTWDRTGEATLRAYERFRSEGA